MAQPGAFEDVVKRERGPENAPPVDELPLELDPGALDGPARR